MKFIQHVPSVLSLVSALVVSLISLQQPVKFSTLCLRVSLFLVSFYILGIIVQKVLLDVFQYAKNEKEQQIKKELEQLQPESDKSDEGFAPLKVNKIDSQDAKVIANAIKTANYGNQ